MYSPLPASQVQPGAFISDGTGQCVEVISTEALGENYVKLTWRDRFGEVISCPYAKNTTIYLHTEQDQEEADV